MEMDNLRGNFASEMDSAVKRCRGWGAAGDAPKNACPWDSRKSWGCEHRCGYTGELLGAQQGGFSEGRVGDMEEGQLLPKDDEASQRK